MDFEKFKADYFKQESERRKRCLEKYANSIENFKSIIHSIIPNPEKVIFDYFDVTGAVALYPNILTLLNPSIQIDKEGLTSWNYLLSKYSLKNYMTGFLYDEDYMIMPNIYFRKSYLKHANFAPSLVSQMWNNSFKDIDLRIALDYDMVRINVDGLFYLEKEHWYGPKFNREIRSLKNGNTKLVPPADLDSSMLETFFENVSSLDIKWSEYNSIKEVEIEEIKSNKVTCLIDGKTFHPVRYIHAEFDLNKDCFRHFDGAIHLYTKEEYDLRKNSDLNYNDKISKHIKAKSIKLFKLNGSIKTDLFMEYSGNFLSKNPLFHEYIEGELPEYIKAVLKYR